MLSGRMHSPIRVPRCAGRGAVLFSVLAVTSAVLFKKTFDERDDFDASGRTDADAHDSAVRFRTYGWLTAGGAIALGGLAAVVVSSAPPSGADSAGFMVYPIRTAF